MRPTLAAVQAAVLLPYAALAWALWFVCDDAYISFRYARHAALGHGLRYNLGPELPVEGYSNLLWTLIAALVELIGAAPPLVMPALSVLCGAGLVLHATAAAHRLGLGLLGTATTGLLLACSPIVGTWASSGLETMPAAWALFALFDQLVLCRGRRATLLAALAAAALSLLRTEGPAWVLVIVALAALCRRARGEPRPLAEPAAVLALTSAVVLAHVGWRYQTYGDVVSNTARAKVGLSGARVLRGLTYVLGTWASLLTPALALLALPANRRWGAHGAAIGAMAVGVPAWCVLVGGDYMAFGRMLLAGLPFAALTAGAAVEGLASRFGPRPAALLLALGASLSVLPAFNLHLVPEAARDLLFFRTTSPGVRTEYAMWRYMKNNAERWVIQGKALAQLGPTGSLVTGAIGARGYYSGLYLYDRGGLVTRGLDAYVSDDAHASPGHDVQAPRAAFLEHTPTWLDFNLEPGASSAAELRRTIKAWRVSEDLRDQYAPRIEPVEVDGARYLLLVLERSDEAAQRWQDLDARLTEVTERAP